MIYSFEDFELDTRTCELRHGGETRHIEPQVYDVLLFLIEHRDRVVTKSDLLDQVWANRFVSEATLSSRLKAARAALDDDGKQQRLIKTIHGRGYRFIGELRGGTRAPAADRSAPAGAPPQDSTMVGREPEMQTLRDCMARANTGRRQMILVAGGPGQGKTTLVQAFLEELRAQEPLRIAHGQCFDHHGTGEAYMPLLEAMGRLCRQPDGAEIVQLLSERAPTWMVQMPWLLDSQALEGLRQRILGNTRERMLREMVETLEYLSLESPFVLLIEDLHWSDPSTVDFLSWLARRPDDAQLLVLATLRPAEMADSGAEATLRELHLRGICHQLELGMLSHGDITTLLEREFPGSGLGAELGMLLFERTGGQPLFVRTLIDKWMSDGKLRSVEGVWQLDADTGELLRGIPSDLQQLIEQRADALDESDRALVEAAAVAGSEFSAAGVASALERPDEEVEARCAALARNDQWLRSLGSMEWDDGTVSTQFAFSHDLYQEVLYEQIPAGRRAALHGRIADRLERGYGKQAAEHGPELAGHFLEARRTAKAVQYLGKAARQALRRAGHREAMQSVRKAFELLPTIDDARERGQLELGVQMAFAPAMLASNGMNSSEAEEAYARAVELAEENNDTVQLSQVLYGISAMHEIRGEFEAAQRAMNKRLSLDLNELTGADRVESHELLACSFFHQGRFEEAVEQADAGYRLFELGSHSATAAGYGENPGISCLGWSAYSMWFLGDPESALESLQAGLALAEKPENRYTLANCHVQASIVHQLRGEVEDSARHARIAHELAQQYGFVVREAMASVMQGWSVGASGDVEAGIELMEEGLTHCKRLGAEMDWPYFLCLLSELQEAAGRLDDAMSSTLEALDCLDKPELYFYGAEIHRRHAELLAVRGKAPESEAAYLRALEIARHQKSRAIELRTAISLARLQIAQAQPQRAKELLAGVLEGFGPGLENADIRAANELFQGL